MKPADIEFDEAKRRSTLEQRGLDFADAAKVFASPVSTAVDDRRPYGEPRYQTLGLLDDEVVMVVWTPRGDRRRIISMRRCHAEEKRIYFRRLGS